MSLDFIFRLGTDEDMPYIYSTFPKADFISKERPDMYSLVKDIYVACLEDAPQYILGYALMDKLTLHYLHVRHEYRRQGIGTKMMDNLSPSFYTLRTPDWMRFITSRYEASKRCPAFAEDAVNETT